MPEMPEVEIIVRVLRDWLVGETVSDVRVRWARSIAARARARAPRPSSGGRWRSTHAVPPPIADWLGHSSTRAIPRPPRWPS